MSDKDNSKPRDGYDQKKYEESWERIFWATIKRSMKNHGNEFSERKRRKTMDKNDGIKEGVGGIVDKRLGGSVPVGDGDVLVTSSLDGDSPEDGRSGRDKRVVPSNEPYQGIPNKTVVSKDMVNNPPHYTSLKSGNFPIEAIDVTEHFNFCRGNVIKYVWRAGLKGNAIEDLEKAKWYLDREIKRLKG